MRKCIVITLCLFCWNNFLLWAQNDRGDDIPISVDIARFQSSDNWTLLEIYFSFLREELEYIQVDDQFQATYSAEANIFLNDSLLTTKGWKEIDTVDSLGQIRKGQHMNNLFGFYIQPGEFKVQVKINDLNQLVTGWADRMIEVIPYSKKHLEISDVELAIQIRPDSQRGKFIKNGYRIIPNQRKEDYLKNWI